ncbi:MAG: hypothetical protein NVS3B12_11450 [Acidimicrobiales bacterium]
MPQFTPRSGEGGWGAARADLSSSGLTPPGLISSGLTPSLEGDHRWPVEWTRGTPGELHGLGIAPQPERLIRWCVANGDGLVLGSAQKLGDIDAGAAARHGLEVVRRRSGGSAVLVGPRHLLWVDVVIGASDPLWSDDVGRAPLWLGRTWVSALARAGVPGAAVHDGAMQRQRWGALVCFAGAGPGEVFVGARKVIGISQRRTREGVLFQCAALIHWDPQATVAALAVPDRRALAADLRAVAVGIDDLAGPGASGRLADAFLDSLP